MPVMKSQSWIIIEIGVFLFILGMMSVFYNPAYEKGVWTVITVFGVQLANLLGSKSGGSLPQQLTDQKPGQTSETETKTKSVTAAAPPIV